MEAGWSRMNDLIIIQASQVRADSSSRHPQRLLTEQFFWFCAGALHLCIIECVRCQNAWNSHRTWSSLQLWALVSTDCSSVCPLSSSSLSASRTCTHTSVRISQIRKADTHGATAISRVPFSVKRLNAACGVMITGKEIYSESLQRLWTISQRVIILRWGCWQKCKIRSEQTNFASKTMVIRYHRLKLSVSKHTQHSFHP